VSEQSNPSEAGLKATAQLLQHGRTELGKIIAGQPELVDQALITVLCQGHALVEGVPGIAKTMLVKLMGRLLGFEFHRVQATPDLMPADILGTTILHSSTQEFRLHRGPVFTDFLLVDEINRMPPRTQAALLECMEERQVTIDGVRHPLSERFTVFATQNPIDSEGTYPLPEAQLDRFLLKIKVGYPSAGDEKSILQRHREGFDPRALDEMAIASVGPELVEQAKREVRSIHIESALYDYIVALVRRSREWPMLTLGASPRAAVSLMRVAQANAALEDRDFLIPDDVKAATLPVLRHRLILRPEAELEGYDTDRVLTDILAAVPVPKG
jgi:MoxR-like ATPase